jgi:hypothetical protein
MSLTKTEVYGWKPSELLVLAKMWRDLAANIEGMFGQYESRVKQVNSLFWQGEAATAALTRAQSDRGAAARLADHLERVADIAENGFHEIDAPLRRTQDAIDGAVEDGFGVTEVGLRVYIRGDVTRDEQDALEPARVSWQEQIWSGAEATALADTEVSDALNNALPGLRAAFVSPATLGSEQAAKDAQQLLDDPSGHTPDQRQRLAEAGTLTPEQLLALKSGDFVPISASQMEYMNAIARRFDHMSGEDLEAWLKNAPADARAGVASSFHLLSTKRVIASVQSDAEVPASGAPELLPRQMHQSLTRSDLATTSDDGIALNGVADNQAAARIADWSDPALQNGTGLDAAIMDAAVTYLDHQVAAERGGIVQIGEVGSVDLGGPQLYIDGAEAPADARVTEDMINAVAADRAVVGAAVAGENGQAFMTDVANHEWPDDNKTTGELYGISDPDAGEPR